MSGVTILNVKGAFLPAVYEHQNIVVLILIILFVVSLVSDLLFISHEIVPYIFLGACILSVLFACAQPIRYDVILDNSVSYNEFIEKYDVIEVNGKIYTVKLKEQ